MVAGVECGGAGLHQQLLYRPAVGGGVAPSPPLLIQGTKVQYISNYCTLKQGTKIVYIHLQWLQISILYNLVFNFTFAKVAKVANRSFFKLKK